MRTRPDDDRNIFGRNAHSLRDRHSNAPLCRRENRSNVLQITQQCESFVMEFVELDQKSVTGQLVLHKRFSTGTRTLKQQRQEKGEKIRKSH